MEYHETVWHRRYLQALLLRGHPDCLAHDTLTEYLAGFYIQIFGTGDNYRLLGTGDTSREFGKGVTYGLFCTWDIFRLIGTGILTESLTHWILG
jgi:hypothetical protein